MSTKNNNVNTINRIIKLNAAPAGFGRIADELSAKMFASALPTQHSHSDFDCDEQGIYIGVWDTTEMIEAPGRYSCDEFMVILEGVVEIQNNKTGVKQTVIAGESFIIPQGYDCQWHQQGYLRKFYVINEPPTQPVPQSPIVESIVKLTLSQTGHQYQHNNFCAGVMKSDQVNCDLHKSRCHMFYFIVQGELKINEENGTKTSFNAGDAFFIPKNSHYRCQATADAVVHYVEL